MTEWVPVLAHQPPRGWFPAEYTRGRTGRELRRRLEQHAAAEGAVI